MLHYPVEQTLKLDFRPPAARQPRYPGGKVCEREYVFTCAPDAAPARRYANAAEADNTMFEQQRRRRDAKAERPKSNLRRLEQQRGLCLPKMAQHWGETDRIVCRESRGHLPSIPLPGPHQVPDAKTTARTGRWRPQIVRTPAEKHRQCI